MQTLHIIVNWGRSPTFTCVNTLYINRTGDWRYDITTLECIRGLLSCNVKAFVGSFDGGGNSFCNRPSSAPSTQFGTNTMRFTTFFVAVAAILLGAKLISADHIKLSSRLSTIDNNNERTRLRRNEGRTDVNSGIIKPPTNVKVSGNEDYSGTMKRGGFLQAWSNCSRTWSFTLRKSPATFIGVTGSAIGSRTRSLPSKYTISWNLLRQQDRATGNTGCTSSIWGCTSIDTA